MEYRRNISFWRIRVANIIKSDVRSVFPLRINVGIVHMNVDAIGVFICGKRIHRRKIVGIALVKTPEDFSAQGKHDVDTKTCFAFHLGEALDLKIVRMSKSGVAAPVVFTLCDKCNQEFQIEFEETGVDWVAVFCCCPHCEHTNHRWLRIPKEKKQ